MMKMNLKSQKTQMRVFKICSKVRKLQIELKYHKIANKERLQKPEE